MNTVIESYYAQVKMNPFLLKQKMAKFSRHPDIAEEFAYWISNKVYKQNAIVIEGHTAQELASQSEYLMGEGAFLLMIDLREKPEKVSKQIAEGFRML